MEIGNNNRLKWTVIKRNNALDLVLLSFLGIQRLRFPAPLAAREGQVTRCSQLSVRRYAACHFQAIHKYVCILHTATYPTVETLEATCWDHSIVRDGTSVNLLLCAILEHNHVLPASCV